MQSLNKKTSQFLTFLIAQHPKTSVTSIMKLAYLADLMRLEESKKKISNFVYKRYHFGPFNKDIYEYLDFLTKKGIILAKPDYTPSGDEYVLYRVNDQPDSDISFNKLSDEERTTINKLIDKVKGYGAKALTEIAYETKPMKKLKATIDGNENLNKPLGLST